MNKNLYGPSLREIANHFFPEDGFPVGVDLLENNPMAIEIDLDDVVKGLPSLRPSDIPLVSQAPTANELLALVAQRQRIQSKHKPYAKSLVRPGRLIWFDSIKSDQPSVKQRMEFGSALGVVLDCPASDLHPDAWYGWIVSPYTAYATWWDVLIDTCEENQSFDTSACVIHARQKVSVFPELASYFSVAISMTDVARIQAVSDEFLKVMLHSIKAVFLDPDHDGIRKTLGDLKVRTGSLVKSDTDPRIAFAKIISVVCSEVTELSYAHAFSLQTVGSLNWLQERLKELTQLLHWNASEPQSALDHKYYASSENPYKSVSLSFHGEQIDVRYNGLRIEIDPSNRAGPSASKKLWVTAFIDLNQEVNAIGQWACTNQPIDEQFNVDGAVVFAVSDVPFPKE